MNSAPDGSATLTLSSALTLNTGALIPQLGLGTYKSGPGEGTKNSILWALEAGYRHIDGAWFYGNEAEIADAIKHSGIPRDDLFITSKVWNDDQGYDATLAACARGLERMGLEAFDLYLVHWPVRHLWRETWVAMERLAQEGKCRAIGASNFTLEHMRDLLSFAKVTPAVDQIELSPFLQHRELVDFCQASDIVVECFSPLTRGLQFGNPTLVRIALSHDVSPAQVLIRWALQRGFVTLPKSSSRERIFQNADVYRFSLSTEDMASLDGLDCGFSCQKPGWASQFSYEKPPQ